MLTFQLLLDFISSLLLGSTAFFWQDEALSSHLSPSLDIYLVTLFSVCFVCILLLVFIKTWFHQATRAVVEFTT